MNPYLKYTSKSKIVEAQLDVSGMFYWVRLKPREKRTAVARHMFEAMYEEAK